MWVPVVLFSVLADAGVLVENPASKMSTLVFRSRDARELWTDAPKVNTASTGYRLDPERKSRRYVYDGPVFRATVHSDGTVQFNDKHGSIAPLFFPILPAPLPEGTKSVESEIRKLLGPEPPRVPVAQASAAIPIIPSLSPNRPDIKDICVYPRPCFMEMRPILIGAEGHFDISDEILRLVGTDPYRHEKARFLAATLDFRTRFAEGNRREDQERAVIELPARLRAIWHDPDLSLTEKRRIILDLKAEMDTNTDAGRKGARMIDLFLQRMDSEAQ